MKYGKAVWVRETVMGQTGAQACMSKSQGGDGVFDHDELISKAESLRSIFMGAAHIGQCQAVVPVSTEGARGGATGSSPCCCASRVLARAMLRERKRLDNRP